jgi:XTP/dITP diphosphohydrolase
VRVVLATANPDKAREIRDLLAGFEVVPRPSHVPDVDETEDTLEGNARLKARAVAEATGEVAVADDTGLEVLALGGRPGVRAARYAGENATYADNVAKLLDELTGHDDRRARFRTVAVAWFTDGHEVVAEGSVEGRISRRPSGTAGFGYDPVFVPDGGDGRTFAEMTAEEKASLSHRGRAFRAMAERLAASGFPL